MRIINIDKPKGWTSFDVVCFVKRHFREKKAGHLGTLDPMATGVLPVFLGKATRLIPLFNEVDKSYRAVCKLGERTDTFDAEGAVLETQDIASLTAEKVRNAVESFRGRQEQQTPIFSAVKIQGVPAYQLARQGKEVPRKSRSVIFHELQVESLNLPFVQIRIHCSKGTYIRTLADDLGQKLKAGAHLTALERLACGSRFRSDNSVSIEELRKIEDDKNVPWFSPEEVLKHLETVIAKPEMRAQLQHGQRIKVLSPPQNRKLGEYFGNLIFERETTPEAGISVAQSKPDAKVIDTRHNLVAVGVILWENDDCYFQPTRVFI